MAFEMALWRVAGAQLERLPAARLDQEQRLEDWIFDDSSVLGLEVALIGRQIPTAYGGRIDLLGVDREGNSVLLELKRDRTPRDIVAQVLDYATWVKDLGYEKLDAICQEQRHRPLPDFFEAAFGQPMPEAVNASHSMVLIASELDESSERIINYLADDCGVNINAVFFRFFKHGLTGTFHSVSEAHLQRYCHEFEFRWNYRVKNGFNVFDRAAEVLKNISGKRLTYRRADA